VRVCHSDGFEKFIAKAIDGVIQIPFSVFGYTNSSGYWHIAIFLPTVRVVIGRLPYFCQPCHWLLADCHISANRASVYWQIAIFLPTVPVVIGTLPYFCQPCQWLLAHCHISANRASGYWHIAIFLPTVPVVIGTLPYLPSRL
jgi:hypothetical protein